MDKILEGVSRLLFAIELKPMQGRRFQPTGFPDLGAAEFPDAEGKSHLLVESAQSMANRLEWVCWNEAEDDLVPALKGMPYVKTQTAHGPTNSLLEAHRLNSPYLEKVQSELLEACDYDGKGRVDRQKLARYLLRRDPNSLLHGIFFSNVKDGRLRLPRLLSAFIEAEGAQQAPSGGVKFDQLDPQGPTNKGLGHVPFHRVEYTAEMIRAYFNLDLHMLRSLGLEADAQDFLVDLALFKIRSFLDTDLRLRTACDLDVVPETILATRPAGWELPPMATLVKRLQSAIQSLTKSGVFASPAVLEV